jgi:hypothetical protein
VRVCAMKPVKPSICAEVQCAREGSQTNRLHPEC